MSLKNKIAQNNAQMIICSKYGTTKNMILQGITKGAYTIEKIEKVVKLCDGSCVKNNSYGAGCRDAVRAMLEYYGPLYKFMLTAKDDHNGCNENSHSCSNCSFDCKHMEDKH